MAECSGMFYLLTGVGLWKGPVTVFVSGDTTLVNTTKSTIRENKTILYCEGDVELLQ